jgi:phosphate transport system permease protein
VSNVRYGVLALIIGSLSVTTLAMLIAVPFGLGAAVFVSEFCGQRARETLKVVIELLAAIPSVVWGFIGISVMNPLIQHVFSVPVGLNVLNGALLLALMSVPIIVSIGEDALKAGARLLPRGVDGAGRHALGDGAARAAPGRRRTACLRGVLLGVGRAIGETMAVLMATGHAINIPKSVFDPVRTLTATIAAELGEASSDRRTTRCCS